jgi:hypothetical protein
MDTVRRRSMKTNERMRESRNEAVSNLGVNG